MSKAISFSIPAVPTEMVSAANARGGLTTVETERPPVSATLDEFFDCLQKELEGPLPGRPAQALMAPLPRPGWHPEDRPDEPARQSGVLVLLYPYRDELRLPLILRPTYDGAHSGQVGFPGGGCEEGDANLTATALREAQEELGIAQGDVQVLGELTQLYIRPSNYQVSPTVGRLAYRPKFQPHAHEVAQLLEVPLKSLLDPAHVRREWWQLQDRSALVPFFAIQGQVIWGATAMILSELLAVVRICRAVSTEFV